MSTVVKIENLWKEYRLGVIGHGTLSHDLQSWWARVRGREDPNSKIPLIKGYKKQIDGNRFWALTDINLDVEQGEVLGIIGKNGAGKSTVLKILSRVTAPTLGLVKVKGRIASLLEVGTGFHPELTGRENIFMNGAILGMSKPEIRSKLDEIIDFSGIEEFIDTPVKRYSSGMYVRLAFAVAAHLEPEILVVDEVLAVGDAEFQKKCMGKIGEVAKGGRTVLFVSHNMAAVKKICSSGILLENGSISYRNTIEDVVQEYLKIEDANSNQLLDKKNYKKYRDDFTITGIAYEKDQFIIDLFAEKNWPRIALMLTIKSYDDVNIFKTSTGPIWGTRTFSVDGKKRVKLLLSDLHLVPGFYKIGITVSVPNVGRLVQIEEALILKIEDDGFYQGSKRLISGRDGYVMVDHSWEFY